MKLRGFLYFFLCFLITSSSWGSNTCRVVYQEKDLTSEFWKKDARTPAFQNVFETTAQGQEVLEKLGFENPTKMADAFARGEHPVFAKALKERTQKFNSYIQEIHEAKKVRGIPFDVSRLTAKEAILLRYFAERNLVLTERDISQLRGKPAEQIFKDLEPKAPHELKADRVEKKEESLREKMRGCRLSAPKSQERKNFWRAYGVQLGTTVGMTVAGHAVTYGMADLKTKDIATDILPSAIMAGVKHSILNDRNANLLTRWARASSLNMMRLEIDTIVYYFQPFKSKKEKEAMDSEEHFQTTVQRQEYNLGYNLLSELRSVPLYAFLQGLRCLADRGMSVKGRKVPKFLPDLIQVADSVTFSMVYFRGRRHLVDEGRIERFNENVFDGPTPFD